ncbi:hypothetical protein Q8W71_32645 [Methylobacterium sp. NEAU 140]|uniref:hypothetical protein n=1 Tax=Methylobacterium sp. NEAU 140 TaxID=3064945 RepID=UPI00273687EE|nr:hypothetical protein [Methylobacterium sp. NEAU 140]MDP4027313.1 hypothetical protein [Methylobacterium sp. NEAU 140]
MALLGAPERCVHVADRESDIYELFCLAQDLGTRFLVRVQTNRLTEPPPDAPQPDADHRVFAQLDAAPWAGRHRVAVSGEVDETACLHVKFAPIQTLPPIGKRKRYSPQILTYIHALERDPFADRPPIDWKLVTNLPVVDLAGAIEKLDWYALRWKAEMFHKVMKSGCRAEEARLQTAERLVKFLALVAVVSWRVFFLTMSARLKPKAPPDAVLTAAEINALDCIDAARSRLRLQHRAFADYRIHPVKDAGATVSAGADHFPPYGRRSALSVRRSHRW